MASRPVCSPARACSDARGSVELAGPRRAHGLGQLGGRGRLLAEGCAAISLTAAGCEHATRLHAIWPSACASASSRLEAFSNFDVRVELPSAPSSGAVLLMSTRPPAMLLTTAGRRQPALLKVSVVPSTPNPLLPNFLWRLAKQSIPTNEVRHRRNMTDSSGCQLCGSHDSWRHTLLDCTMSRCVWPLVDADITEHMAYSSDGDARVWLAIMIDTLKEDEHTRVFVTLWAIWHARRKAIHEQVFQRPLSVHYFVENFISDLAQCGERKKQGRPMAAGATIARWIAPPPGMIKINVDGEKLWERCRACGCSE